ncbi:hypothetical protein [Pectobacterium phage vB_ParM-25]|nr:hypothetical protein [Pectobacterium phage vB_ParM-25]
MGEDSLIVLNGVETELGSVRDYLAFERLGFCGCGLPDEVDRFWVDQIVSIDSDQETIDYIGYAGGLEYFIQTAIRHKALDDKLKLTPFGKLLVLIIRAHYDQTVDEEDQEPTPVITHVVSKADSFENVQDKIDYFLLRALVVPGIIRNMELPNDSWSKTYEQRQGSDPMNLSDGVYYWVFHSLGDLGWEEHGGSAPGWLTSDGEDKLCELIRRFGIDELSIFSLIEKGFTFREHRSDYLTQFIPEFEKKYPNVDWKYIYRLKDKL